MEYLDLTFASPAENLAFDEFLLDWRETTEGRAVLRFWQPESSFVVLGYGNSASREVKLQSCREKSIPIYRRCSGGGTILQMKGCLNYSLILPISGELESIPYANKIIMQKNADAISALIGNKVSVCGDTDLSLEGRKFSGNAQRRKKRYLLFHGCLLLQARLEDIPEVLDAPSREPAYRKHRDHLDFVRNLDVESSLVQKALEKCWGANQQFCGPGKPPEDLVCKYNDSDWIYRFK